jgi:Ohr subfamily peroxiredoxin
MTSGSKTLYTAKVHTTGGRDGAARSSDGRLDVRLSVPGGPGAGTNPEQLFAAGWSACFEGAMAIAAKSMNVALPSGIAIDADIDLCHGDDGYFLRARLNVSIPGMERGLAQSIVEAAERTCPYSKALRGNVDVSVALV